MTNDKASTNHPTASAANPYWVGAATAAALAGTALFNHWRSRKAEDETPPAGRFVEVDGTRLHYVERGAGPPVVLLHGNGVTLQDFEASGILDMLAANHRVLAFDRPGFGYSDRPRGIVWTPTAQADLIHRALQQLGVRNPVVAGHSWGTLVALAMALEQPGDIAGLVLISGYYFGTARPDVLMFSPPALPLFGDLLAHTVSPLTGRLIGPAAVKASFAPAPVTESFTDFPVALTLRPAQVHATAADTALMVPEAIRLSARYGELDLPLIVLAGAGDLVTHIDEHAERLVQCVAGAELRRLEGVGHMLHYSAPDQVVDAIEAVVRRAGERRRPATIDAVPA